MDIWCSEQVIDQRQVASREEDLNMGQGLCVELCIVRRHTVQPKRFPLASNRVMHGY